MIGIMTDWPNDGVTGLTDCLTHTYQPTDSLKMIETYLYSAGWMAYGLRSVVLTNATTVTPLTDIKICIHYVSLK